MGGCAPKEGRRTTGPPHTSTRNAGQKPALRELSLSRAGAGTGSQPGGERDANNEATDGPQHREARTRAARAPQHGGSPPGEGDAPGGEPEQELI